MSTCQVKLKSYNHAHPPPVSRYPKVTSVYHFERDSIRVDLFGLCPTEDRGINEVYQPQCRRSPATRTFPLQHLETISTWKRISSKQAAEISFWEIVFRIALERQLSEIMLRQVHVRLQEDGEVPGQGALKVSQLLQYLGPKCQKTYDISISQLIQDMIDIYHDKPKFGFDWLCTEPNLPIAICNFVRTQDCFDDVTPTPRLHVLHAKCSPRGNNGVQVAAEVLWRKPKFEFTGLPYSLPPGKEYQLIPQYTKPVLDNYYVPYEVEESVEVGSAALNVAWDQALQSFRATVPPLKKPYNEACKEYLQALSGRGRRLGGSGSAEMGATRLPRIRIIGDRIEVRRPEDFTQIHEVLVKVRATTFFPGDVQFKQESRYIVRLGVTSVEEPAVASSSTTYLSSAAHPRTETPVSKHSRHTLSDNFSADGLEENKPISVRGRAIFDRSFSNVSWSPLQPAKHADHDWAHDSGAQLRKRVSDSESLVLQSPYFNPEELLRCQEKCYNAETGNVHSPRKSNKHSTQGSADKKTDVHLASPVEAIQTLLEDADAYKANCTQCGYLTSLDHPSCDMCGWIYELVSPRSTRKGKGKRKASAQFPLPSKFVEIDEESMVDLSAAGKSKPEAKMVKKPGALRRVARHLSKSTKSPSTKHSTQPAQDYAVASSSKASHSQSLVLVGIRNGACSEVVEAALRQSLKYSFEDETSYSFDSPDCIGLSKLLSIASLPYSRSSIQVVIGPCLMHEISALTEKLGPFMQVLDEANFYVSDLKISEEPWPPLRSVGKQQPSQEMPRLLTQLIVYEPRVAEPLPMPSPSPLGSNPSYLDQILALAALEHVDESELGDKIAALELASIEKGLGDLRAKGEDTKPHTRDEDDNCDLYEYLPQTSGEKATPRWSTSRSSSSTESMFGAGYPHLPTPAPAEQDVPSEDPLPQPSQQEIQENYQSFLSKRHDSFHHTVFDTVDKTEQRYFEDLFIDEEGDEVDQMDWEVSIADEESPETTEIRLDDEEEEY